MPSVQPQSEQLDHSLIQHVNLIPHWEYDFEEGEITPLHVLSRNNGSNPIDNVKFPKPLYNWLEVDTTPKPTQCSTLQQRGADNVIRGRIEKTRGSKPAVSSPRASINTATSAAKVVGITHSTTAAPTTSHTVREDTIPSASKTKAEEEQEEKLRAKAEQKARLEALRERAIAEKKRREKIATTLPSQL